MCHNLASGRYCPSCDAEVGTQYERYRGSSAARGYGARWRRLREMILRRDAWCVECKQSPATEVDHIVSKARGGTDHETNLQGLCKACHSRKTLAGG